MEYADGQQAQVGDMAVFTEDGVEVAGVIAQIVVGRKRTKAVITAFATRNDDERPWRPVAMVRRTLPLLSGRLLMTRAAWRVEAGLR